MLLTNSTKYGTIKMWGEGMASIEKIIEKMKNKPNGIRIEEAQRVLEAYGYRMDRQRGSHKQFIGKNGEVITVKSESPLKAVYVKDILRRIGR